jgi:hypothetical protein
LRAKGEDPGAFAFVKPSGPNRWHAVVQRSDGSVDDPSREAGMGSGVSGVADEFGASLGVCGAAVPLMVAPPAGVGSYIARPQLAMRPVKGPYGKIEAWQARADLPWHWGPGQSPTDVAMAALHASPVSSQAIAGACFGASQLGAANDADEEHLDRLEAIGHMLEGASWGDVAYEYGPEHATAATHLVGSFFGSLKRGLGTVMHAASPLAHMALPFVPGVGPIAARAFDMAEPALQHLLRQGGHLPPRAMAYPAPRAYPQAYPVHPPFQHCEQSWHCYE